MSTIDSIQNDEEVYLCSFNRNHDSDYEAEQLESGSNEKIKEKTKKNTSKMQNEFIYESSENFIPFQHTYSLHEARSNLSYELEIQPFIVFLKFFSNQQMKTIVNNTNIYAYANGVKKGQSNLVGEGRNWTELTIQELKI